MNFFTPMGFQLEKLSEKVFLGKNEIRELFEKLDLVEEPVSEEELLELHKPIETSPIEQLNAHLPRTEIQFAANAESTTPDDTGTANEEIAETKESEVEQITTRNQDLEGQKHPETGVPFERKTVENHEGEKVEGVFPEFDSIADVDLPDELHEGTDREQFNECNKQLKERLENDPEYEKELREEHGMSDEQIEQIKNGDTPDGYTWHHDAEKGKMQLVDSDVHAKTGHTGGKAIWGGGSDNR